MMLICNIKHVLLSRLILINKIIFINSKSLMSAMGEFFSNAARPPSLEQFGTKSLCIWQVATTDSLGFPCIFSLSLSC